MENLPYLCLALVSTSFPAYLCSICNIIPIIFNCRMMGGESSTFEDIVDAYLAYLQVSFANEHQFSSYFLLNPDILFF